MQIKNALPKVIVSGIATVERAVINEFKQKDPTTGVEGVRYNLLVEGYNLPAVMATPGIDWKTCKSNHIIEMQTTYGYCRSRNLCISQLQFALYGLSER